MHPHRLLGLNPLAVGAVLALNLFNRFRLHTDLVGRLGPLELVFNTPAHHRVRHASNPEYLDRNYGGILRDRLFGTFAAERPGTAIASHEWRAMARDVARARACTPGHDRKERVTC
ncbi:MAG TPA: hypothetical protein VMF62_09345 [Acetobacteraceae bacterium]|jgi:sterol desaturase/sphingolipid hydroxylase (fatty acid hydroxylase superfamily)|nr:hypothetical protein [Acetobacteraceae bacterium]